MVTIYDIAKRTGFSPPTVSKALNGTGSLSEATRLYILNTAKELGYTPNLTARTLTTRSSHLIGIIFEDYYMQKGFEHPLFSNILNSFKGVLETEGYDLLFLSRNLGGRHISYLDHCNFRNVDGILIITIASNEQELAKLAESRLPCVSVNDVIPGISAVLTDNLGGAKRMVQYLAELGHRRIAYIAGPGSSFATASAERFEGYRQCLGENGIPFDPSLTEQAFYWHSQGGYEAARKLLARTRDFTAIFAANDSLAYGALKALEERGLMVPGDISVAGFDGDELGEYITPRLTTMTQNTQEIGSAAGLLLLRKLAGEKLSEVTRIPPSLIIRSSCRGI
ncbi:MAG: LacI family transcriptional regulator [Spirochaetaceae bacterium]|jgi:LacI family transcriptional regulator|nr:LacI family transcriptional regulator [Spirochaetaceae bacterium]